MFNHARRLKEIADANKSAFANTTGTEWWLAEAPVRKDSSKTVLPPPPSQPVEPDPPASPLPRQETTSMFTFDRPLNFTSAVRSSVGH
jgi:hypothetical protein